jgi:hypothetical protein
MTEKPVSRRAVVLLIAGVAVLPLAAWAVVAVAALLGAMEDAAGELMLRRIAWLCGALWAIDLVCLVVALAINSLCEPPRQE